MGMPHGTGGATAHPGGGRCGARPCGKWATFSCCTTLFFVLRNQSLDFMFSEGRIHLPRHGAVWGGGGARAPSVSPWGGLRIQAGWELVSPGGFHGAGG